MGRDAGLRRAGRGRAHAATGLVASLRVEPYETGRCCRTSARTRGRRRAGCGCSGRRGRSSSRSSCSTTASRRSRRPDARARPRDAEGTRLWRVPGDGVAEAFADRQLLIADGHHRYETALAYAAEEGTPESARMMVVLVSTSDPGLEIFPTHRLFRGHDDALPRSAPATRPPEEALARLAACRTTGAAPSAIAGGVALPVTRRAGRARRRARRSARRPRGARLHGRRSTRRSRAVDCGRVRRCVPAARRRASRTSSSAPAAAR